MTAFLKMLSTNLSGAGVALAMVLLGVEASWPEVVVMIGTSLAAWIAAVALDRAHEIN